MRLSPGEVVNMWDWPEFEKSCRPKLKGKIHKVEGGNVYVWTEQYAGMWSNLRVLPIGHLIEDRKPKSKQAEEYRERERIRRARKRSIYKAVGIAA